MGHVGQIAAETFFKPALVRPKPAFQPFLDGRFWLFGLAIVNSFENIDHAFAGQWTFKCRQMMFHSGLALVTISRGKLSGQYLCKCCLQLFKVKALVADKVG